MLWDAHLHTSFSGDCDTPIEDQINRAIELSLRGITVTDHMDYDFLEQPGMFDLDVAAYNTKLNELMLQYNEENTFTVRKGIELGLQEHLVEKHTLLLREINFDYVIGSIHLLHGHDPYYPSYYEGRTSGEIYKDTWDATLSNLIAFPEIDALGHLDYMKRYICREFGPAGDYKYSEYQEQLDAILMFLISHDIALEINTGAFRAGLTEPNPGYDVIRRYKELGGKLITLGADAHFTEHVGLKFNETVECLKQIGFTSYYIYKARVPEEVPFI